MLHACLPEAFAASQIRVQFLCALNCFGSINRLRDNLESRSTKP